MNEVGGFVNVLVEEPAGIAAIPVENPVELTETAAAGKDALAVLVHPVEIIVDGYVIAVRFGGRRGTAALACWAMMAMALRPV